MPFLEILLLLAAAIPSEDEDQRLGVAIRNGDERAFRTFFDRYHVDVYRYLVHRKVDPDVAHDLVQNAFVHIWESRASIRDNGSLRGLLYRIAYTRALNHFRDTARFSSLDTDDHDGAVDHGSPGEQAETRDRIRDAVALLPERRRAVFELCVLQGFTYREAAEALEVSIKTVENQMGHALKAVRSALSDLR